MRTCPHKLQRSDCVGFTVAEVVIASSVLSVLSVIGITTVCLLMTAEQRAMESFVVDRTIADLADELRQDVHAAMSADINDELTTLKLQLPDETHVTYQCTDEGVGRTDATVRNEWFHLPFGRSHFELSNAGRLIVWRHEREPALDMSFSEPSHATDQPRRTYRIEAALALQVEVNE